MDAQGEGPQVQAVAQHHGPHGPVQRVLPLHRVRNRAAREAQGQGPGVREVRADREQTQENEQLQRPHVCPRRRQRKLGQQDEDNPGKFSRCEDIIEESVSENQIIKSDSVVILSQESKEKLIFLERLINFFKELFD